ncbi:MAG: hypothetical protein ICV87_02215, partial [Gemmatimonadetes bacterium]|nr:hypothetical protein [Gemmatimonadota bacterium]
RSSSPDSSALAGRALASWENTDGRFRAEGEWLRVGQGFTNAADPRLSSGLQEIRLAGTVRVSQGSLVTLSHERQRFDQYGVERHNTLAEVQQNIAGRPFSASGGLTTDMKLEPSLASSSLAVGRMSFAPTDRVRLWTEANRNLAGGSDAAAAAVRPDQLAAGVSYRIFPTVSVEGSHRWLKMGGDSVVYGVSGVSLRMESLLGGQVWGGIERPDNRSGHAMVLGWNQKVALSGGWAATSLFERRFGVEQAPLADPTRALPFVGTEQSHWSTSLRLDYLPGAAKARFSTLGEVRDAGASRSMRLEVAGDLPLGRSVAMLGRSNWWRQEVETPDGIGTGRRDRSLFGLALRPAGSDALNALVRMEWRRNADAAVGGVLGARGEDTRMIGSTDLVWSARPGTEVTGRYALRWTLADAMLPGYTSLGTQSHFAGTRVDQALHGPLSARMDARLLAVGEDQATFWNLAPSAVLRVARQIDVEGGYRFGNLMDPDFGAQGGKGWFATLGFHFTEGTLGTAADFWRERLFNDR